MQLSADRRLLRDTHGDERETGRLPTIDLDNDGVLTGALKGEVDHDDAGGLDLTQADRWLAQLDLATVFHQHRAVGLFQPERHPMHPDIGLPPPQNEHQMGSRMDSGKLPQHHLAPDPDHRQLALLVHQCMVTEQREVDPDGQLTRIEVTTSPCTMAMTTSIPSVT